MQRHQSLQIVFKVSESPEDSGGVVSLENGSTVSLYGSSIQVVWDIQESLNLSFDIYFHNWSTALKLVANGSLDWGASSMSLSEGLAKQALNAGLGVDFLHPLSAMTSNVYFRPPPSEQLYGTIFRPFALEVWVSVLVCILLCTVLMYKLHLRNTKVEISSCNSQSNKDLLRASPSHVFLQMIQLLRGRYFRNEILELDKVFWSATDFHWHQGFAVLVGTSLASLMTIIYTAKIAAIFARNEIDVKSPEDLVKYGYAMTSFSDLHFERLFKEPRKVQQLFEKKFLGANVALENVIAPTKTDPRFAFLTHANGFQVARNMLNFTYELCTVSSFASTIKMPQSMYLKKGSPFREQINLKIIQLLERGLNYRYQHNYRRQYEFSCGEPSFLGFTQLSNRHLSFTFILLIMGAVFASLVEMIIYMKRKIDLERRIYRYRIRTIRGSETNIRLHPL